MKIDKAIKSVGETTIQWYPFKYHKEVVGNFGWCLVILKPANWKELSDCSRWVTDFGFNKAWLNDGKIWIMNQAMRTVDDVTDNVALIAPLPEGKLFSAGEKE